MKKILLFSVFILTIFACKKEKFSPVGPTDVRVKNLSDLNFVEVIVDTSGGIDTLGDIAAKDTSEYFRFEKAYPKAEISAKINGEIFSTEPVSYTYLTYIGQAKITYHVFISSMPGKKLEIHEVTLDAPLD
jgi:hypothetical protein